MTNPQRDSVKVATGQSGLGDSDIRLNYGFWLEVIGKGKVLTEEGFSLLLAIEQTGSVRQAAEIIRISYNRAWSLLKAIEGYFGFDVIIRRRKSGANMRKGLTIEGMELLNAWRALHYETEIAFKNISNVFFRRLKDIYSDK